jgi:hypothetical protein
MDPMQIIFCSAVEDTGNVIGSAICIDRVFKAALPQGGETIF